MMGAVSSLASSIVTGATPPPRYNYRVFVKAGGTPVNVISVVSLERSSDYRKYFYPHLYVTLFMGRGSFVKVLRPFADDIEVTVQRINLVAGEITETLYRGLLHSPTDRAEAAPKTAGFQSVEREDAMAMVEVVLQLVDPYVEALRLERLETVISNATPEEMVCGLITSTMTLLAEKYDQSVIGVDVYPSPNKTKYNNVIFGSDTQVVDIPDIVQRRYGIYNSGVGSHICNDVWKVWPLYDLGRAERTSTKLTVVSVPTTAMYGSDKSYRVSRSQLQIISTRAVRSDPSEQLQLAVGNAVQIADLSGVMERGIKKGDKVVTDRNATIRTIAARKRATGLTKLDVTEAPSSNIYAATSQLALTMGSVMMMEWQHSDASLIDPTMPVEVLYDHAGEIRSLRGTLLAVETMYSPRDSAGPVNTEFGEHTTLIIFVEATPHEEENPSRPRQVGYVL